MEVSNSYVVHMGAVLRNPLVTARYIGRYTKRAVLAECRITHYEGEMLRFAFRDYAEEGKICCFSGLWNFRDV